MKSLTEVTPYTGNLIDTLIQTANAAIDKANLGNCCLCGESIAKNGIGTMYQRAGVCLLCEDSYADVEG